MGGGVTGWETSERVLASGGFESRQRVLVATGIWNILAVKATFTGAYGVTLMVKLTVVALSGLSAFFHAQSRCNFGLRKRVRRNGEMH